MSVVTSAEPTIEAEPSPEPEPEPEPEIEPEIEPEHGVNGTAEQEPEPLAEDHILSVSETASWTFVFSLIIGATIVMNILIIYAMIRRNSARVNCLRKPADVFLLSLILARTCVAIFVMPARILAMYSTEGIGSLICKLCVFAGTGSAATSVLCTCAVCISKILDVKSCHQLTTKAIWFRVCILWFVGCLYGVREPFINDIVTRESSSGDVIYVCAEQPSYRSVWAAFLLCDVIVLFVCPALLVMFGTITYIRLTNKINAMDVMCTKTKGDDAKMQNLASISGSKQNSENNNVTSHGINHAAPKQPDTRYFALMILILFVGCYATSYTWKLLIYNGTVAKLDIQVAMNTEQVMYLWTFLNPLLNTLVYLYFRVDIRNSMKDMFSKKKVKVLKVKSAGVTEK